MAPRGVRAAGRSPPYWRADGISRERPGRTRPRHCVPGWPSEAWMAGGPQRPGRDSLATPDVISMQRFARELVALQPSVILSQNTPTTSSVLQQTSSIPVIFATVSDPVGSGFVASLAQPGGNTTGFIDMEALMSGKWLELLKEIAPRVANVAFLFNPP